MHSSLGDKSETLSQKKEKSMNHSTFNKIEMHDFILTQRKKGRRKERKKRKKERKKERNEQRELFLTVKCQITHLKEMRNHHLETTIDVIDSHRSGEWMPRL